VPPDEIRSFIDALTDPDHGGVPRIWTTAEQLRPQEESALHRAAPSTGARAAGYGVGTSMLSPRAISKLFALPEGETPAATLRGHGAVDLLLTDPVPVAADAVVVLHGCVFVTIGVTRATLADSQRGRLYLIPPRLGELVTDRRGATMAELLALDPGLDPEWLARWYGVLIAEDLATVVAEAPTRFPVVALRTEPLPGEERGVIDAIIDQDAESAHDLAALASELDELRCEHLQLRYFGPADPARIERDLGAFGRSRLRTVEVIAPWAEQWTADAVEELWAGHDRLSSLILHGAAEAGTVGSERFSAHLVTDAPTSHQLCGQVHPGYFSVAMEAMQGAELGDSCLRGKVSVDAAGSIRHCPSHDRAYGMAGVDRLADIVAKPDFQAVGALKKREVAGCSSCEFRRVCSHCQVQAGTPAAKPATCTYDPLTGIWDE
jgi:SPASM domain peptide maturase of grasp-with-spasm system